MKILKRVLLVLAVLVVVLLGAGFYMFKTTIGANVEPPPDVELAPGVRQVADGFVTFFVLDGGDGNYGLIDCGNDPSGKVLLADLAKKNIKPEQVKTIFLTHGHGDHISGCHLFPNATVAGFPQDVQIAAGTEAAKGPLTKFMKNSGEHTVKFTKLLGENDELSVGNLKVRAFFTPGHTAGSACYLVNGVLVMGDSAAQQKDGAHFAPAPFSDDVAQNHESISKLYQQLKDSGEVKTVAFSHSASMQGIGSLASPKD